VLRVFGWVLGLLAALLILLAAAATLYTKTADFQRRVGGEVVSVLENATGGRVELQSISFSLWHLAIEADGLVIHGSEGPGQMPYLSAAKIFVRLHLNMVLTHIRGYGPQSRISLRSLRVEQPRIHLIVYKDGHTNQPTPRHPSTSKTPIQDTLLNLQARQVQLVDGLAVVNDRSVPFDMSAKDLKAEVHYIRKSDRYGATVDLADLETKIAVQPQMDSKLHLTAELGRDMVALTSLDFETDAPRALGGNGTKLSASAELTHFANPQWSATVGGTMDARQLGYLADVDGIKAGVVDLSLHGHSCMVTPQMAQKHPHFWQRHNKPRLPASAKVLPPDPDCTAGYLLVGSMKAQRISYSNEYVRLEDVYGGAQLHITPTQLLFTALSGYLPGGGSAKGQLKIDNWLGEVPANAGAGSATAEAAAKTTNAGARRMGAKPLVKSVQPAAVQNAHAYLTVTLDRLPLRTIMLATEQHYGDLGFDTALTGPTTVEWGGPATDIADTVQVQADLKFTPTGQRRSGALSNVPVSGEAVAHYDGLTEVVNITHLDLMTPQSSLTASGVVGVNNGDPLTKLNVNLNVRNLGEFDQMLQTLDFEANGKKGRAAIPIVLHGSMDFAGIARGAVADLDVKGHLVANDLALQMGSTADVHIDSAVGDGEYSPNEGVAIASSTIKRGTAVLNVMGTFRPQRLMVHHIATYPWDENVAIDASVKLANAQVEDVLQIAGQQDEVPVTGTVNLGLRAKGTVRDLTAQGAVALTSGTAYGEKYQKIAVNLAMQGKQLNATSVLLQAHGYSITGSGGYNLASKKITAQMSGSDLLLSKFDTIRKLNPDVNGVLSFDAKASGTMQQPDLHAKLSLTKISLDGDPLGEMHATADSTGSNLAYELHSQLVGANVDATGQTSLIGDMQTQARLTLSSFNIANVTRLMGTSSFKGSSTISGTVNVFGPAKLPKQMSGNAAFDQLDLTLEGIDLKAEQPLHASLSNGMVTLDQVRIVGQDTDLHASGTAVVFGYANPKGGRLNLGADGSVSMALAHTFDPDLITSGKVTFKIAATGRMKQPGLSGDVLFENVNVAMEGVANGLSHLNGTLQFDEDRLDVKNLTAHTGGGELKIGGFLAYQKGVFADLTATGDAVRVRYNGVSAMANASFRLQGDPKSLLLSGNVLVTRFGIGPDVDFAAFASASSVQAPPDPNSALNKVRLDVHVASSPQLDFQNSFAKLAGTVDLTVRGTLETPSILGRILITEGSATYAGTKYELERGSIYFSNPVRIDPTIDLDATARVEDYDITIGVHGTAEKLKPTYRSEPPLSEADIFNLLALGRTQEQAQLYQQQQSQAGADPTTNALLGGALNGALSSSVGKFFGAGSVKIDPAFIGTLGDSSARITVQEPLTTQLTLVYATNVNETAEQLIQLQYQLNDHDSVVATRDESGVFSLVYKIRKRYH
jgi:translocation and assembly module TamB